MWIFSTIGFFSVTQSKAEPGRIQFRARVKADLETLRKELKVKAEILETPNADYRWRVTVSPWKAARIMAGLMKRIDYSNFKNAMAETGRHQSKLHGLHEIWAVHNRWQTPARPKHPAAPWEPFGGVEDEFRLISRRADREAGK